MIKYDGNSGDGAQILYSANVFHDAKLMGRIGPRHRNSSANKIDTNVCYCNKHGINHNHRDDPW